MAHTPLGTLQRALGDHLGRHLLPVLGLGGGVVTNIISSNTSAGISGNNTHITARGNGDGITVKDSELASSPNLSNISALSSAVLDGATFKTRTHKGVTVQATSIQQIGAMTSVASGGVGGAAGKSSKDAQPEQAVLEGTADRSARNPKKAKAAALR